MASSVTPVLSIPACGQVAKNIAECAVFRDSIASEYGQVRMLHKEAMLCFVICLAYTLTVLASQCLFCLPR